ncbi:hypothetical protein C1750_00635 [Stenotrophomonas pavanii]|nr:hypothetical protein C1750_00635 [Stenotrophomonas pavanii]
MGHSFLGLIVFPAVAFAEGSCPPGFYPIGGQGVQGCAPIPGAAASIPPSQAPRQAPEGEWEKRWGAIAEGAVSSQGGSKPTGTAVSQRTESLAQSVALDACRKAGGGSCRITISYYNQCADPVGALNLGAITVSCRNSGFGQTQCAV